MADAVAIRAEDMRRRMLQAATALGYEFVQKRSGSTIEADDPSPLRLPVAADLVADVKVAVRPKGNGVRQIQHVIGNDRVKKRATGAVIAQHALEPTLARTTSQMMA